MGVGTQILKQLGKEILHGGKEKLAFKFPRDFEMYAMTLELLLDGTDIIDSFTFPVMPTSIVKVENERTTISKALRTTTVISSDSTVPKKITISGDFGRAFKLLIDSRTDRSTSLAGETFRSYSIASGIYSSEDIINSNQSNSKLKQKNAHYLGVAIKTGYGSIKILQSIISKAKSTINGKPLMLHLYNRALGESYLVAYSNNPLTVHQDVGSSNMIWHYTLSLDIIAELSTLQKSSKDSLQKVVTQEYIQNSVNNVAHEVTKLMNTL